MEEKLVNMAKARERESAKEQGFFDGRFRHKVMKDKKKEYSRKKSRRKLNIEDF
jgi:hypothetical protein